MNAINSIIDRQKTVKVRKTRSDKKKSVRVWVNPLMYRKILKNSKLNNMTITAYCSAIVANELREREDFEFEKFMYQVEDHIVHIKLAQSDYEIICSLSAEWMITSIRETVHRVLLNGLLTEGIAR